MTSLTGCKNIAQWWCDDGDASAVRHLRYTTWSSPLSGRTYSIQVGFLMMIRWWPLLWTTVKLFSNCLTAHKDRWRGVETTSSVPSQPLLQCHDDPRQAGEEVKFISTQHSCLSDNTDTFILVDTWTRHNPTLHCCDKRAITYRNSHSTGNCTSTNTSTYACARVRVGIWMITLSVQEAGHHEVDRHILDCSIWHFMVVHGYKWRHYRSLKWRHYRSLKCAYDGVIIS